MGKGFFPLSVIGIRTFSFNRYLVGRIINELRHLSSVGITWFMLCTHEVCTGHRMISSLMQPIVLPFACQSSGPSETAAIAAQFATLVNPGDIILLSGPLGAGKTQFVRGFCQGMGMTGIWEVDSPTYTVVNHYDVGSGIDHIDLYRLSSAAELEEIDFDGMMAAKTIKLIEWPERLDDYPIERAYLIKLAVEGEEERSLTITPISGAQ